MSNRGAWSVTDKLESARRNRNKARDELMAFVGILTRMYDAHVCKTRRPQKEAQYALVVCVHVPAIGKLSWQLCGEAEQQRFNHLPLRENDSDRMTQAERIEHLDMLSPRHVT